MARLDELITAEFAVWEQRGRGWQVWQVPVRPEPAYREFTGYQLPDAHAVPDDSRKPSFLASLADALERKARPAPPPLPVEPEPEEPNSSEGPLTVELVAHFPRETKLSDDALRAFLEATATCREPVAFELVADAERVSLQFVASEDDAPDLERQLAAFFPELAFVRSEVSLPDHWVTSEGTGFIVEFGLGHEFMLPLQTDLGIDPFVSLISALSELRANETAVFQVLFEPVKHPWPSSIWRSVTDEAGKALFINRLTLIPGTKEKVSSPLFGVIVRTAAKAASFERAADVVIDVAGALRPFHRPEHNRLIPLHNDDYPYDLHEEDLLSRQSHRSGMLLNREELLGLVHFPGAEVQSPRFRRQRTRTKAAPASVQISQGVQLGINIHSGRSIPVRLSAEQRVYHLHLIGATGSGKSTLLFEMIRQDIASGQGLALLDPHGDLAARVLGIIPESRHQEVILIDPTDTEHPIGINILSAHDDREKASLASDLVSIFRRLSTSWGEQMESVLRNSILAILESPRGGTLYDLRRFLLESDFRKEFLQSVTDPEVAYYWQRVFPQLSGNKSIGPVLTRLQEFLSHRAFRNMVAQRANRVDFTSIMDGGKILVVKLSTGLFGKENAHLLGSLVMARLQQTAMARERQVMEDRRDFWIYADEFQEFITPSLGEMLGGTRKYRVGLTLAHQELRQLDKDRDLASAVLANANTRIVFKVGDDDARKLADGFSSFEAADLQNLDKGQAICRVGGREGDFNLTVPLPEEIDPVTAAANRESIIAASRKAYATPSAEVEAQLRQAIHPAPSSPALPQATSLRAEPPLATPSATPIAEMPQVSVSEPALVKPQDSLHQAIKDRIGREAESLDFRVSFEEFLPDSQQRVDLVLRRGDLTVACEISSTNTVDFEAGTNIVKCLRAGFPHVFMICSSRHKLGKIQKAFASLALAESEQVEFLTPDQMIARLYDWAGADPEGGAIERGKPRKRNDISFEGGNLTERERQLREADMRARLIRRMEGDD